jgi:HSP20 family molecular chaperone IbpA
MKLRFHANTLRLRLSQSDVARLAETGRVEEQVTFAPGQTLAYVMESVEADDIGASFEDGKIRVTLPRAAAKRWMEGRETGIESSGGPLHVLIEKDFQCLHPDSDKDGDAFPNPLA